MISELFIDLETERNFKMKKRMKILVAALAVVMVLGVCSTVFAGQTVKYDGKCYKNFYATKTLTKINDTHLKNHTDLVYFVYNTLLGADITSKIYIAGVCRATKVNMGGGGDHILTDVAKKYTGTCKLQIVSESSNSGEQIGACGSFSVY